MRIRILEGPTWLPSCARSTCSWPRSSRFSRSTVLSRPASASLTSSCSEGAPGRETGDMTKSTRSILPESHPTPLRDLVRARKQVLPTQRVCLHPQILALTLGPTHPPQGTLGAAPGSSEVPAVAPHSLPPAAPTDAAESPGPGVWKIGPYLVHLAQMCKSECPNMLQESLRETLGIIGVMGDQGQ